MIPEIKYNTVNWIDGMKISKNRFIESDRAHIDAVRDSYASALNEWNYGLLPGNKNSDTISLDVIDSRFDKFKVRINTCRALTIGGCRIEILSNIGDITVTTDIAKEQTRSNKAVVYDLVLMVNPYDRTLIGQANPEELPLRIPFTSNTYSLHIQPADQAANNAGLDYCLTIGRVLLKGDDYVFDTKYVPPCTTVMSHPTLINYYRNYGGILNSLEENCTKIIQKVISKNQTTSLAVNIKNLSERLLYFIANIFFDYRQTSLYRPPIFLVDYFIRMANTIRVYNDCLPEKEKEEMLLYFSEWTELNAGNFDSFLNDIIFHDYDHKNILNSFQKIDNFLSLIDNLLAKLNQLDLIGKRKDRDIFVREKSNAEKKDERKGWSLLE